MSAIRDSATQRALSRVLAARAWPVVAVVLAAAAGAALAWATHPRTQRVAVTVAPTAACPGVRVEVGQ